ncbi:MAG: deoxyribose-phosphate aldolase [Candidatus Zixiibacteriota bacterium]
MENLNKYFDHSILTPETDQKAIEKICREATKYNFFGIAINPFWVPLAKRGLSNTDVKIVSVSGFPLSANSTIIKVAEAIKGVEDGADEIDMVANVGLMVSGKFNEVEDEIYRVKKELPNHIVLKVIIEAPKLSPVAQVEAVRAVINGGADFVKTATGFFGGATVDVVRRLKETANGQIKVKASGGIRTLADTIALINAGADRIGSSSSVAIMEEFFAAKTATK